MSFDALNVQFEESLAVSSSSLNNSVYDTVPSTPRPLSRQSHDEVYDTVIGPPVAVKETIDQETQETDTEEKKSERNSQQNGQETKENDTDNKKSESNSPQIGQRSQEIEEKQSESNSPQNRQKIQETEDKKSEPNSPQDGSKRSSKMVKKADSLRDLSRQTSKDSRKVQRSTSFSKKSLNKLMGKKQERNIEEEEEKYAMLDKSHGTLYLKKKKMFSHWRKYFFVLDGSQLTYFANYEQYEKLTSCLGSIDLTLLDSVVKKKPTTFFKTYYPLLLGRRSLTPLYLGAISETEQLRWLELLQKALETRKAASKRVKRNSKFPQEYSPVIRKDEPKASDESITKKPQTKKKKLSFKKSLSFKKTDSLESYKKESTEGVTNSDENVVKEDEVDQDFLVEPKKNIINKGMTYGVPTSQILSVKLKKTNKPSEINSSPKALVDDKDSPKDFGVNLKRVQSLSVRKPDEEETNGEFDFRNILKTRRTLPRNPNTNKNTPEDHMKCTTLDVNRRKRSPSPNLPLSKSLKSVLDKSTENNSLTVEECSLDKNLTSTAALQEDCEFITTKLSPECDTVVHCPVYHAVSDNIRYSDPPPEIEITAGTPKLCHSTSSSQDEDLKEKADLNHISDDENAVPITKVSALQNIILQPKQPDERSNDESEKGFDLNGLFDSTSSIAEGNRSIASNDDVGDNTEIISNECSNTPLIDAVNANSNDGAIIIRDDDEKVNDMELNQNSLNGIIPNTIVEDKSNSNKLEQNKELTHESSTNSQLCGETSEADLKEESKDPNVIEKVDSENSVNKDIKVDKVSVEEKDHQKDSEELQVFVEEHPEVEQICILKNEDESVNDLIFDFNESGTDTEIISDASGSTPGDVFINSPQFGHLLEASRSMSVESGEPLVKTSFMGGRRSWGSLSNGDMKISSTSGSNTSKESIEVPFRKKTKEDIFTAQPKRNPKRNSSGYAEGQVANELLVVRKMRPNSNPIVITNRESLIAPEFVVMEETEGMEMVTEKSIN